MLVAISPAEADTWLHHLIFKQEKCPTGSGSCGIWLYTLTRSLKKQNGRIEISGRILSLIKDGIALAANAQAGPKNRFLGIVYETVESINDQIGERYYLVLDRTEDEAHSNLNYRHDNGVELIISREVDRLHDCFRFAVSGSQEIDHLETMTAAACR